MANDPNTIQYVIQEDGFWYVASKDRTPGVPEITVSAKGIANGLSTEYNDGYDFGPDSYDPNSTASIPYTQTSGIQEAYNYLKSTSTTQNAVTIRLLEGNFYLNADVNIEIGNTSSTTNPSTCHIIGSGKRTTYVWINQVGLKGIVYSAAVDAGVEDTVWSDFSLDVGYGDYGANDIASNPTGSGAESMFQYILFGSGGQGTIMSFINMSFFTGNYTSGYGPTNGGLYIAGIINIIAVNSTFEGDRIINAQGGGGSSLPLTTYDSELFCTFQGGYVGGNPVPAMFSGYLVSFIGCNVSATITGIGSSGLSNSYIFSETTMIGNIEVDATPVMDVVFKDSYLFGNNAPILNASSASTIANLILERPIFMGFGSGSQFANNVTATGVTRLIDGYIQSGSMPVMPTPSTPTISANPPVSATVYQNTNPYDIEIDLPVYATTSGTAGYVTVAKGATSTPSAIGNQYVSGDTSDTSEQIIRLRVPANWYYEFTASGVTFGTASVFAD